MRARFLAALPVLLLSQLALAAGASEPDDVPLKEGRVVRAGMKVGLIKKTETFSPLKGEVGMRTVVDYKTRGGGRSQVVKEERPDKITVDGRRWRRGGSLMSKVEIVSKAQGATSTLTWLRRDRTARVVVKSGAIIYGRRSAAAKTQYTSLRPDGTVKSRTGWSLAGDARRTHLEIFRQGPRVNFSKRFGK